MLLWNKGGAQLLTFTLDCGAEVPNIYAYVPSTTCVSWRSAAKSIERMSPTSWENIVPEILLRIHCNKPV